MKVQKKVMGLSPVLWDMAKKLPPSKKPEKKPKPARMGPPVTHGISDDQVLAIRCLSSYYGYDYRTIAGAFDLDPSMVKRVVSAITQTHLIAKPDSATKSQADACEAFLNDN